MPNTRAFCFSSSFRASFADDVQPFLPMKCFAQQGVCFKECREVFLRLLQPFHCQEIRAVDAVVTSRDSCFPAYDSGVLGIVDDGHLILQRWEKPASLLPHGFRNGNDPVIMFQFPADPFHAASVLPHRLYEAEVEVGDLLRADRAQERISAAVEVYEEVGRLRQPVDAPLCPIPPDGVVDHLVIDFGEVRCHLEYTSLLDMRQAAGLREVDDLHVRRHLTPEHFKAVHRRRNGQGDLHILALREMLEILYQHRVDTPVEETRHEEDDAERGIGG